MTFARVIALTITAAGATAFAADGEKLPPLEVKNRSSFNIRAGTRVPFWPIGWSKEKAIAIAPLSPVQAKAFQIQPNHFTVSSIMLSHPPLATINGRAFGEGEFLPVRVGGQPVKVVVKAIRDGGVWLDQTGHQVFVPMKRQQLVPRGPTDVQEVTQEFKIEIDAKP
jgi:hypothetical protein